MLYIRTASYPEGAHYIHSSRSLLQHVLSRYLCICRGCLQQIKLFPTIRSYVALYISKFGKKYSLRQNQSNTHAHTHTCKHAHAYLDVYVYHVSHMFLVDDADKRNVNLILHQGVIIDWERFFRTTNDLSLLFAVCFLYDSVSNM